MAFLNRCRRACGATLVAAGIALLECMLPRTSVGAAAPIVSTQEVHAAFTLNLTRFVTWPETAFKARDDPLVIGTFPRDPINEELDEAARGEVVEGRPIRTMRLQTLDDIAKCHVVFVSKGIGRQRALVERAAGKPILTISDADGFLELGGHVRFVPGPARTALRISVDNLKASRLEGRAQLLRIAAEP
jgi:hypothetical protein